MFHLALFVSVFSVSNAQPIPMPKEVKTEEVLATDRLQAMCHIMSEKLPPDDVLLNEVKYNPAILKAIATVAVEQELMDEREVRYFFAKAEEFPGDLRTLNCRYHDLKDAPKVWESNLLPPRDLVNKQIEFNRAYHKWLDEYCLWNLDRAPLGRFVQKENQALYQVYDYMRDARCEFYYITVRRVALKKLKAALDDKNGFIQEMCPEASYMPLNIPPNVPIWRFNESR